MAVFSAFFDESGKKSDHPVVTFSGVCVRSAKIAAFEEQWRELLQERGLPALHMKKASRLSRSYGAMMRGGETSAQRMKALAPFADCINQHLDFGLVQAWDVVGFLNLDKNTKHALGDPDDPYFLAFARALSELVYKVDPNDTINLICDDDQETAWDCYRHYRGLQKAMPDIRKKCTSLAFASDEAFPCLQAADMLAYLSRLEAKYRFYGDRYDFRDLWRRLTDEQPVGRMQWFALFADVETQRNLSLVGKVYERRKTQ